MFSEQRIRAGLFYLSVLVFLIGIPFILSFALGYKFNPKTLKFTKTGLIVIKTQPPGGDVYFEDSLLNEKTPTNILELLPGRYYVRVEMDNYYPWNSEVEVNAGKVTRLERIMLFPLSPDAKQLNKNRITSFFIDEAKSSIYYINSEDKGIYKSDLEGERFQKAGNFINIFPYPAKFKISDDRNKLIYFNQHQMAVVYLDSTDENSAPNPNFVLNYPDKTIIDAFWHSDSYHIILVTNKSIEAVEASVGSEPVVLVQLEKRDTSAFYDIRNDVVYFLDYDKGRDGKSNDNLYKLELNARYSALKGFINMSAPSDKQGVAINDK